MNCLAVCFLGRVSGRLLCQALAVTALATACLIVAAPVRAQTCQESLRTGQRQFNSFHQDPGLLRQAIAAFETAAADPACAYEARWRLADLYLNHGTILRAKTEKIETFKRGQREALAAIQLAPNGPEGHYYYAVNLGSQIEQEGALKAIFKLKRLAGEIDTTLGIKPDFAPALVVKARYMADLPGIFGGSDKKAEEFFKKALKADPNCESAYVEYARFLLERKRPTEARTLLDSLFRPDFKHANEATWTLVDKPAIEKLREGLP
jgi:tetratricopeptide (TPR) repeat protein